MTAKSQLLKIFQANTGGHTTIKPPEINQSIERMTGYQPAKITEYRFRGRK